MTANGHVERRPNNLADQHAARRANSPRPVAREQSVQSPSRRNFLKYALVGGGLATVGGCTTLAGVALVAEKNGVGWMNRFDNFLARFTGKRTNPVQVPPEGGAPAATSTSAANIEPTSTVQAAASPTGDPGAGGPPGGEPTAVNTEVAQTEFGLGLTKEDVDRIGTWLDGTMQIDENDRFLISSDERGERQMEIGEAIDVGEPDSQFVDKNGKVESRYHFSNGVIIRKIQTQLAVLAVGEDNNRQYVVLGAEKEKDGQKQRVAMIGFTTLKNPEQVVNYEVTYYKVPDARANTQGQRTGTEDSANYLKQSLGKTIIAYIPLTAYGRENEIVLRKTYSELQVQTVRAAADITESYALWQIEDEADAYEKLKAQPYVMSKLPLDTDFSKYSNLMGMPWLMQIKVNINPDQ